MLGLRYETSFNGLNANVHTFDLSGWEQNPDTLQVWTKLTFRRLGYVGTDTATLFRLTLTVDDASGCWSFTCDCANSGHG